jgi:hypothetical protein
MRLRFLPFLLLAFVGFTCCRVERPVMNHGWWSKREHVEAALRAHGFTYNAEKTRWQDGEYEGFPCERMKVSFDSAGYLQSAEARFEKIDSAMSERIFTHFQHSISQMYGSPDIIEDEHAPITMNRRTWDEGRTQGELRELIVLTRFNDVVIYSASRVAPPPYRTE